MHLFILRLHFHIVIAWLCPGQADPPARPPKGSPGGRDSVRNCSGERSPKPQLLIRCYVKQAGRTDWKRLLQAPNGWELISVAPRLHARQKVGNNPEWGSTGQRMEGLRTLGASPGISLNFSLPTHSRSLCWGSKEVARRYPLSKQDTILKHGLQQCYALYQQNADISSLHFVHNNSNTYTVHTFSIRTRLCSQNSLRIKGLSNSYNMGGWC